MDRILHLHWDRFVTQLLALPVHPDQEEWALAQQAKALLEQLEAGHFGVRDIMDLSDDVFRCALQALDDNPELPTIQYVADAIADETPDGTDLLDKLQAAPDPLVSEVFV